MSKKREFERLNKNLTKEKKIVFELKKKVKDSRSFQNNSTKDYEGLIGSLHEDMAVVIGICIENIDDFKRGLVALGWVSGGAPNKSPSFN